MIENPLLPFESAGVESFRMAVVSAVYPDGRLQLTFDRESTPSKVHHPRCKSCAAAVGNKVICAVIGDSKIGKRYVVIDVVV